MGSTLTLELLEILLAHKGTSVWKRAIKLKWLHCGSCILHLLKDLPPLTKKKKHGTDNKQMTPPQPGIQFIKTKRTPKQKSTGGCKHILKLDYSGISVCSCVHSTLLQLTWLRPKTQGLRKVFKFLRGVFSLPWEKVLRVLPSQYFIIKIFKYTGKLKESYSKNPYIYHLNSAINILLYLLVRIFLCLIDQHETTVV